MVIGGGSHHIIVCQLIRSDYSCKILCSTAQSLISHIWCILNKNKSLTIVHAPSNPDTVQPKCFLSIRSGYKSASSMTISGLSVIICFSAECTLIARKSQKKFRHVVMIENDVVKYGLSPAVSNVVRHAN